ncbi:FAD-binding oxidoreductase [Pararhodobacter sp. CCB-MM2]|uniref:FAD-binding oxidoreductase n=1 Tax=Pararhodobacter sp. CCB-MM2 TaxID=1786003 RepID=UPI0035102971
MDDTALSALRELLGARVSDSQAERALHAGTEAHHAPGLPDAVVWPESTDEVAAIVRLCARHGLAIVPFGAGSSLEGNASAPQGGVCLDMTRMGRVLRVSPEDLDCTVQAGVTREALNHHLRDSGLFFPVDPGANATLGGMAATRASGTTTVRYGSMREAVLSLTVVTPEGEILRTAGRARKSAAGYDLTRLFLGSEGTLGVITEVSLRLFGRPEQIRSAVCRFPDPDAACRTAIEAIQLGLPLARVEYLDAGCIRAVNAFSQRAEAETDTLFLEFHGAPAALEEQIALFGEIAEGHGGTGFRWAEREEERNALWRARHSAYNATVNQRAGAKGWATDVCVPVSALPDCILHAKGLLADVPVPASIMGHVGDGNFHVVFSVDTNSEAEMQAVKAFNDALVAKALSVEGTCTGEHGVGLGKRKYMEAEHGPALALMRRLKTALDPAGLMNPGKIFP